MRISLATLLFSVGSFVAAQAQPQLLLRGVVSDGQLRYYRVHVPASYVPGAPTPVVLGFHGGGGNAVQFASSTRLDLTADAHGFLAVFPEGTNAGGSPPFTLLTWNGGDCCGAATANGVDDVQFVRDLLDDLASEWSIDPNRLYATGFSNGGILSYRLGIELGDVLAAVAPVGAALQVAGPPLRPIALMAVHGAADFNVPSQGGIGIGPSGTVFNSQVGSLQPFFDVNQAIPPSGPDLVVGQAQLWTAPAPATGADIHYWWLVDQGHSWPGTPSQTNPGQPINTDITVNDELWSFFAAHPRERSAVALGSGCSASAPVPSVLASPPLLDFPLTLTGQDAPTGGIGRIWISAPTPVSFFAAGCEIFLDPASTAFVDFVVPDAGGSWAWSVLVPADPSLHGVELHAQVVFGPPSLLATTNGLWLRLAW